MSMRLVGLFFVSLAAIGISSIVLAQSAPNPAPVTTPAQISAPSTPSSGVTLGVTPGPADATGSKSAANSSAPEVLILHKIEADLKQKYKNEIYVPPAIPSLIFTPSQQSLLREARNGFNTRVTPTDNTLNDDGTSPPPTDIAPVVIPGLRTVSLGGIVFMNPDDWTIWLNKKRFTAAKLPPEAIDLRVYKDFIEVKWLDNRTNQVFPIRLRPNQTFNLDAHMFVPG